MKKAIIFSVILFTNITGFPQQSSTNDSSDINTTAINPASANDTGHSNSITGNNADTVKNTALRKENVDSTSLFYDLSYQQQHPEILYAHKAKNKIVPLLVSLLMVVILGLYLMFKTGLCRNLSYDPATSKLRALKERPFSFARMQLFWWTLIILTCFSFFYFYTGFLPALNPTIILLLGGGLAVSIFGKIVDNTQMEENANAVPIRHQDLQASKGIFADILSDEGGISIHRFQSLIFNIIFGFGFISSFYSLLKSEKYPFIEFENWQLTLLGISAAGYLGFKSYENSKGTKTDRQIDAVTNNAGNADNITDVEQDDEGNMSNLAKPESSAFRNLKNSLTNRGLITPDY